MKFLVLGSGGMAGHVMALYLKEAGEEVSGLARHIVSVCPTITGNARDEELLSNVIDGGFDVVINCIGILNKNVDNDLPNGIYINSYLPHFLAKCCDKTGAKLIHISTDCVFCS